MEIPRLRAPTDIEFGIALTVRVDLFVERGSANIQIKSSTAF
jgi:hypothetical protein